MLKDEVQIVCWWNQVVDSLVRLETWHSPEEILAALEKCYKLSLDDEFKPDQLNPSFSMEMLWMILEKIREQAKEPTLWNR